MALVLNERFRLRGFIRTIILAPWAVSGVVTGFIWLWLFDGTIGVVNDLLMRAGVVEGAVAWGIQPATTWAMVFIANAWRGAPFFAIVILAALQAIDPALYEVAHIDGASRWQRFRYVTMPLILNAVVISTLLRALWTFNFIDLSWTMTRGGPAGTTTTLPIYIFDVVYQKGEFGYARSALHRAMHSVGDLQRGILAAQSPHEAPRMTAATMMVRRRIDRWLTLGVPCVLFLAFTLFPIYWLVNSSLKPAAELFTFPPRYWPDAPTLANYTSALFGTRLSTLYINSVIVATLTCGGLFVLIIFAGFAMARYDFRGRTVLISLFLLGQVLPHVVMLIPAFVLLKAIGLLDTRASLVLVYIVILLPFSVMTMRAFYQTIPVDLEEAGDDGWLLARRRPVPRRAARSAARPGRHDDLWIHQRLERADLRGNPDREPQAADASGGTHEPVGRDAHRVRPASRYCRARTHPEPAPLRLHPALPDRRTCGRRSERLTHWICTRSAASNSRASAAPGIVRVTPPRTSSRMRRFLHPVCYQEPPDEPRRPRGPAATGAQLHDVDVWKGELAKPRIDDFEAGS